MTASHSDPRNRQRTERPARNLPVSVGGSGSSPRPSNRPVPYDHEAPGPDWRLATTPLYPTHQPDAATTQPGFGGGQPPWGGWPPADDAYGHRGGRAVPGSPRRSSLGRRAVVGIAALAVVAGSAVGAGVAVIAHHGASGATRAGTSTVKEVNAPATTTWISRTVKSVSPAIVEVSANDGNGSGDEGTGMIITSNGEVLTNNHVIDGATSVTVALNNSTRQLTATVIGADPGKDVALIQIHGARDLPTVTLANSGPVQVGDPVVAIGNALALGDSASVTSGIVSALGRTITAGDSTTSATETLNGMIQTDAAINPGNSGGALLNSSGQVIGMNTAAAGSTSDGSSAQNIGFAIPSNRLVALLPGLRKGGDAPQGNVGSPGSGSNSGGYASGGYGAGSGSYGDYGSGGYGSGAGGSGGADSGGYSF